MIANAKPTYKIVAGWRRLDQEAYPALKAALGEDGVSQAVLDHYKWGAFWDAPLRVPGDEVAQSGLRRLRCLHWPVVRPLSGSLTRPRARLALRTVNRT